MIIFLLCINATYLYAEEVVFSQEDRERLIRLDVTLKQFMEATNMRFDQVDKRFEHVDKRFEELREDMNKRFEQVDKRFEQVDKRFEQMFTFLWIITGIFTTLTGVVIIMAFWDRRTIIRKAREETIEQIEKEGRLTDLINALRELSKVDPKVETVLRQFHLL